MTTKEVRVRNLNMVDPNIQTRSNSILEEVRSLVRLSTSSTYHNFLNSPDLAIITNIQNSRIVTVMRNGSIRFVKLWDTATGKQLWEHEHEYTDRERHWNLPSFSPDGNYVAFHDGGTTVTILDVTTLPIRASREVDIGEIYGKYKCFALGTMGRDISILKVQPSTSRKHERFDIKLGCIHVFEIPRDIFGKDDDRRNLLYSTEGTQLILTRLSKTRFGKYPDLVIDIYEFSSDKWQPSRRFNMTEVVYDVNLLSGGLVNSDARSFLALKYKTSSIQSNKRMQRPWREEQVVLEVALEGVMEGRCTSCTQKDAFLSGGCLVLVGQLQREGQEPCTCIRVWDDSSPNSQPTIYSAEINYSTGLYQAIAFSNDRLTLLSMDGTLIAVNVVILG